MCGVLATTLIAALALTAPTALGDALEKPADVDVNVNALYAAVAALADGASPDMPQLPPPAPQLPGVPLDGDAVAGSVDTVQGTVDAAARSATGAAGQAAQTAWDARDDVEAVHEAWKDVRDGLYRELLP